MARTGSSLFESPPGCQAPPICHPGPVVKFCLPLDGPTVIKPAIEKFRTYIVGGN